MVKLLEKLEAAFLPVYVMPSQPGSLTNKFLVVFFLNLGFDENCLYKLFRIIFLSISTGVALDLDSSLSEIWTDSSDYDSSLTIKAPSYNSLIHYFIIIPCYEKGSICI